MASGVRNLVEEHQTLSRKWLKAEQTKVGILQNLIQDWGNKCTMDLPENFLREYETALAEAAAVKREYVQWLAEQGFPSS